MEKSDEELSTLIDRCATGDGYALEVLYKRLSPYLNGYAYNIVRCEALSNEVLQDSFVQIWQHSARYCHRRGAPLTWICAIVRNRAIDKLRAETKHLRFSHTDTEVLDVDQLSDADQLSGVAHPENEAARQQSSLLLNQFLSELSLNEQRSINLAYMQGCSRTEIADVLDANVNTVKSWLRRGLKHLQRPDKLSALSH